MKYAYDYRNMRTRGWVRGEFADFGLAPSAIDEAVTALEAVAKGWATSTDLRLVRVDDNGTETFPPVAMVGTRGPLPKDK